MKTFPLLTVLLLLPSLYNFSPTTAGQVEEEPKVECVMNYTAVQSFSSPSEFRAHFLPQEGINLTSSTLYLNLTPLFVPSHPFYIIELELENNSYVKYTIPAPYRNASFTFHLILHFDKWSLRFPKVGELPFSFGGEVVDKDKDGMDDRWEVLNGLDPSNPTDFSADQDKDGLSARQEYTNITCPLKADSDGDGMDDGWEVHWYTCPYLPDSGIDVDGDGLSNYEEYIYKTDPRDPLSKPYLAPLTPWYYIVVILAVILILIGYFIAQMFVHRREDEFLFENIKEGEGKKS